MIFRLSMELAIILKGHEQCSPSSCISSTGQKCCLVGANNQEPSFKIVDYSLFEIENVQQVGMQHRDNYGWDVAYDATLAGKIEQFYFCIDGIYNQAWSHWVAESAYYLVLWDRLKTIYPGIKIYSLSPKNYKNAMYKSFNISPSDVVYSIEAKRNKFIFPSYGSWADHTRPFLFQKHMAIFYNYFVSKMQIREKDIDILYLPRGSRENNKGTDRKIAIQPALIDILSTMPNVRIFFTDETDNMLTQWELVQRARVILLNEGGNLLINGYFAKDSKIISLGGDGNHAHFQNPAPGLMYYDTIRRRNKYYHIPYEWPPILVVNMLIRLLTEDIQPVSLKPITCWRNCKYCNYQDYIQHAFI